MEKYSQFRDKGMGLWLPSSSSRRTRTCNHDLLLTFLTVGTGIAPFFPIPTTPSGVYLPFHIFLFCIRVPILLTVAFAYFAVLQWFPIGVLGKKAALWLILGTPGIWWVDLQIDGVRRG